MKEGCRAAERSSARAAFLARAAAFACVIGVLVPAALGTARTDDPDETAPRFASESFRFALARPPLDEADEPPAGMPGEEARVAPPVPYGARGLAALPRERMSGALFLPRLALLPARAALRAVTLPVRWTGAMLSPTGLLQTWAQGIPCGPYIVPLVGVEPELGANVALRAAHGSPFDAAGCITYRLAYGGTREQLYGITARSRDVLLTPYENGWGYALTARYDVVPDKAFFGLGNATLRDRQTFYTLERYLFLGTLHYAPTGRMRWDFTLSARRDQIRPGSGLDGDEQSIEERFPDELFAPGIHFDAQNVQAEIGLVLDGRDHRGRPTDGMKSETFLGYAWGTGADLVDYVRYGTELELYRSLSPRHVLAMRFSAEEARTGSLQPGNNQLLGVKITERPSLGGPSTLRGYLRDRFIDNAAVLATFEYRYRVSEIVEATVFADFGKVMWRLLDFDAVGIHRSWGAGFRFATDEWMYFRVQAAASDEDVVFTATMEPVFDPWDRRERR